MQKLLIISGHLSTGGSGQVTANKIELIRDKFDILMVEYAFTAPQFVVQRNRIIALVGKDNFISLGENKFQLLDIIKEFEPDVISFEECPEFFMDEELATKIYARNLFGGNYEIIETTHDSSFNYKNKQFRPDRYVFVSPYNALKLIEAGITVPFEIIEYPVDTIQRDKMAAQQKLGLDKDYEHVVIVGLFTPRKNQAYVFDLAETLLDRKIQFHFIGNLAGNFQSYWQPLLEKKQALNLDNCIIWGERDDVDDFMQAADLFLFASKGDRGNKELLPIVIKDSYKYDDLPKVLFNLDVYLNRFNDKPNTHFLNGNVHDDSKLIAKLCRAKKKELSNELIIIGTYPNLKSRVQLTKDTIKSLRPLNRKIMLVSHYPVDAETQKMVDYYVYDKHNPMIHHSYYTRFFNHTSEYDVDININGLKHSNQSLAVLTNMINGANAAKDLGFGSFFYTTYDVVTNALDYPIIEQALQEVGSEYLAYASRLKTPFGHGIQTNGMAFNTDFFLENFGYYTTAAAYHSACERYGAHNFLEDFLMKRIGDSPNLIFADAIDSSLYETMLKHSGMGVASNSEYYSIVPVHKKPNTYMLYFFTYNVDDRKVRISTQSSDTGYQYDEFVISKQREFKKEIVFKGNQIDVVVSFFDGDICYKNDIFTMDSDNIDKYNHTGFFKPKNPNPKIKLVHIQTTRNDEKEQKSRASVVPVADFGMEYTLHCNVPYGSLPPKHNCLRPLCVSMELFTEAEVEEFGTSITPQHYGCFEAFKNAILSEFDNDLDFIIICEGDCILQIPPQDFVNKVHEICNVIDDTDIGYFSFGDTKTLAEGWPQSPVIETIPDTDQAFITNHIIGLQCIMFPKKAKRFLHTKLREEKWDCSDMFFNYIFAHSPFKMGILYNRITTQADGFSLIDKEFKTFK
jgi:glycosyltransferase involved in cell wall biosynthesis